MGKGGKQTTEVKMNPAIEKAALQNMDIANEVAAIGATPYGGPTIAGFSPQQLSAMQATDNAMSAFGMPSAMGGRQGAGGGKGGIQQGRGRGASMTSPARGMSAYEQLTGMPPPNAQSGGFSGYSAQGLTQDAYASLPPAQRALIESFVMDPVTGAAPSNASVPAPKHQIKVDPKQGRTAAERAAIAARNRSVTSNKVTDTETDAEKMRRRLEQVRMENDSAYRNRNGGNR